jgi:hypothetical protein
MTTQATSKLIPDPNFLYSLFRDRKTYATRQLPVLEPPPQEADTGFTFLASIKLLSCRLNSTATMWNTLRICHSWKAFVVYKASKILLRPSL